MHTGYNAQPQVFIVIELAIKNTLDSLMNCIITINFRDKTADDGIHGIEINV